MSEWRPVVGYEAFYEVSDAGEVRSLPRRVGARLGGTRVRKPHTLATFLDRGGYKRVHLTDAVGHKNFRKVHHLVAAAFAGPKPPGLLVLHRDDDKFNNSASNLYYGTHQDNNEDCIRNGHHKPVGARRGEKHHLSKLKETDIPTILSMAAAGVPLRQIGFRFGLTDMPIHDILRGRTWGWLTGIERS